MSVHTPAPGSGLFAPLRVRNFRNLWLGQTVSLVGDQFKFVALSWLVLSVTGRPGALGTVLMLQAIPRSILMLAGGVLTDRMRPRTVMLLSDVLRAAVVGTIAVLTATERITMPHILALALIFGVVHAFFFPAASAMIPEVVGPEALRPATAINQATSQVVLAAAPALAGAMIAVVGVAGGFAVDAASFLVSALFLLSIRLPAAAAPAVHSSAWSDFVAGLRVVRADTVLLGLMGMASLFFFGYAGATFVGLPVLAKGPLGTGPAGLGLLFTASGLGALAGGLVGGAYRVRRRGRTAIAAVAAAGGLVALMSQVESIPQAGVLLFLTGMANAWMGVTFIPLIQSRTDRAYMGRVMALLLFGVYGLYPVSYGLAGWISQAVGVRALFTLGGAMIVCSAALGLFVRDIRQLE